MIDALGPPIFQDAFSIVIAKQRSQYGLIGIGIGIAIVLASIVAAAIVGGAKERQLAHVTGDELHHIEEIFVLYRNICPNKLRHVNIIQYLKIHCRLECHYFILVRCYHIL